MYLRNIPRLEPVQSFDPSAEHAARQAQRIRAAYSEWLRTYDWHHYADLTFEFPLSAEKTLDRFRTCWIRRLERSAKSRVDWVAFSEKAAHSGAHHLHALLHGTQDLTVDALQAAWPYGFSRVRIYNPARDAAQYVCKLVACDSEWDLSPQLHARSPDVVSSGDKQR